MPINYAKWEHVQDSSDEEEAAGLTKQKKPVAASPSGKVSRPTAMPTQPPLDKLFSETPPNGSLGRAAVCSTMKDVQHRITSWVQWHLHLGFERLYIFFDDANETESVRLAQAAGGGAVIVLTRGSEYLTTAWKRQPSWTGMGHDADKDVQIRQLLNAQLAMELARSAQLTWLLHMYAAQRSSHHALRPLARAPIPPARAYSLPAIPHRSSSLLMNARISHFRRVQPLARPP